MMSVLLTGAFGFVGRYVYKKLVDAGFFVIPVDYISGDCDNAIVADISDDSCISMIKDQLGDNKINGIVHLAACINMSDTEGLIKSNCLGTMHMVELAKELKVDRFVYLSSVPIIGIPKELPITENHVNNPRTVYHSTKYIGEQLVENAGKENLSVISLRIASPVGREKKQKGYLERLIDCCKNSENIEIYGKGARVQNYIDVRDLAEAVRLALVSKECKGLYLIKGGMTVSNAELAEKCLILSSSKGKINYSAHEDIEEGQQWIIDGSKAERELHYSPQYEIEDTVKWLLE